MPFPKLSQLQSRFAVSLGATIFLILLYLTISRPSFAYATEINPRIPSDYAHPVLDEHLEGNDHDQGDISGWYSPDHIAELLMGMKERRALDGVSSLANNAPQNMNIEPGQTQNWVVTKEMIEGEHGVQGVGLPSESSNVVDTDGPFRKELKKRQSISPVYITINTCLQPTTNSTADQIPPQLQLRYSTSTNNQKPGPSTGGTLVDVVGGYALLELNVTSDVYVGLSAPNTTQFTGLWNYEIAASNDAPYHFWSNETDLLFVDGDNHAALLVTPDLTKQPSSSAVFQNWMSLSPAPYGMFAHHQTSKSILGISRSYCGLLNNAKIKANILNVSNNNVGTITNRGLGGAPKEQFYLSALDPSSSYYGWLAMSGNSTSQGAGVIGGGGSVWTNMTFATKQSDNCALMYNLTFCSEVAYAVPSNPEKYSPLTGLPDLAAVYDSYAAQMYQYFNYSLQQIPCNTTDTAQYSLARNCDDCARAYKQWLCATTIPRCEDWANLADYLQPRNIAQSFANGSAPSWVTTPNSEQQTLLNSVQSNSSRNSQIIDDIIQPGPYKEVLPCIDLCYDLVQSCPAALGFGCPSGRYQNMSYGVRDPDPGIMRCSYLGAAYYLSAGVKDVFVPGLGLGGMGWLSVIVTIAVMVF